MSLRKLKLAVCGFLICAGVWLAGCGSSSVNVITVTVSPPAFTLVAGQSIAFTASVGGSTTTTVTWTCSAATTTTDTTTGKQTTTTTACSATGTPQFGTYTIDSTTNVLTYTAPPLASFPSPVPTITLTAAADADKKKTGTTKISLDSGIRVGIAPTTVTVPVGLNPAAKQQFNASLQNTPPLGLQWTLVQPDTTSTIVVNQSPNPLAATCTVASPTTTNPGCGSIDQTTGIYTAPMALPTTTVPGNSTTNATTLYVVVNSTKDTNHFAIAQITLVNSTTNPITFTGITPTVIAAGGVEQDIFLNAHNFLNTTPVTFTGPNGNAQLLNPATQVFTIPISAAYCTPVTASGSTAAVDCDASIVTRVRLNAAQLAQQGNATISAVIPDQANPGQTTTVSFPLTLVPARPGLVAAVPDSFPAGTSGSTTFSADGGYYGGGLVNFYLNGGLKGTINTSNLTAQQLARQLLESVDGSQLTSPGLYPVSVVSNVTSNLPQFPAAYSNVAVQPAFGNLVTNYNLLGTPSAAPNIALPGGANSFPSSIVVNSKRKYALVTEEGTDYLRVLDLSGAAPKFTSSVQLICKNAAPCQPTGVAYTDTLHLLAGQDTAVVVNSAGQSLSLLAVSNNSATLISTVDLSGLVPNTFSATPGSTPPLPYAVGVDPATNYAVVAFSNSSLGFIVDLNPSDTTQTCFLPSQTSLPCAISSVSLTTGVTPQIVLQPGVPLAYVSPGGNGGVTSVVNLLQKNDQVQIAPASSTTTTGAIRTANVVTIITLTPHGINPATGGSVLITNASPADLNGAYQVNPGSVLDPYTFSYSQTPPAGSTLADVTNGGGGYVQYGAPYYPFTTSSTSIGDAINPITRTLAFADFNTTISQIILVDGLDQSVSSLSLAVGTCHICTPTQTAPERGFRSVAFDPYTNVLIAFNPDASRNEISLINPGGLAAVGSQAAYRIIPPTPTGQSGNGTFTPTTQGATPITVYGTMAYDPQTNQVLALNAGSGSLTYLNINPDGQFKPVHIESVQVTSGGVPNSQPPLATSSNPTPPLATCNPSTPKVPYSSCFAQSVILGQPATLQVFGKGFQTAANAQVRLDGVTSVTPNGGAAVPITTTVVNDNEVDAAIPAGFFSAPHDYALDVLVGAVSSNVTDLHVVGVQPLPACSSAAAQPEGVAIDDIRHVAVVTNYGCNSISVINLDTTGTLYNMPYGAILGSLGVGKGPIGVAVIPRMGLAVTANNLDGPPGTASIIDISTPTSPSLAVATNVNVGIGPTGVAIDQDRAIALIANSGSVTLSAIDLTVLLPTAVTIKTPSAATVAASGPPTAIAVDPNRAVAVVTNIQNSGTTSVSGGLDVINLAVWPPARSTGTSINSLTANPTGIVYDPAVSPALFYVTSTLQNAIYSFNPDTPSATLTRVGTKPYSVAYNYQTGGLISINSTSQTSSIVDTQTFKTHATLGISSQSQFSVAVDNFTNTAVIVDQNNNRVLIMALPK